MRDSNPAHPRRTIFPEIVYSQHKREHKEIPFVIAVLGNFSGIYSPQPSRKTEFISVNSNSIDNTLATISPTVDIKMSEHSPLMSAVGAATISLAFKCLADFEPENIAPKLPSLREDMDQYAAGVAQRDAAPPFISGTYAPKHSFIRHQEHIESQLNCILHAYQFQHLHATWTGLKHLAHACTKAETLQLQILDITKHELIEKGADTFSLTLNAALEVAMSTDSWGGHPPSLLVADYEFGFEETTYLRALGLLATKYQTVVIAGASHEFLPLDSYEHLNDIDRTKGNHIRMARMRRWRDFRNTELAQRIYLTIPPVLLREPYKDRPVIIPNDTSTDSLQYNERLTDDESLSNYLWGNGAYALASVLSQQFAEYGWVPFLSPLETSGTTTEYHIYQADTETHSRTIGPTRGLVWHHTNQELASLGFIPLVACKGTPSVAVFEDQSTHADGNNPSSHLLYQLTRLRLEHCFRSLLRHYGASGSSEGDLQAQLQEWLASLMAPMKDAPYGSDRPTPIRRADAFRTVAHATRHELAITIEIQYGASRLAEAELTAPLPQRGRAASAGTAEEGIFKTNIN